MPQAQADAPASRLAQLRAIIIATSGLWWLLGLRNALLGRTHTATVQAIGGAISIVAWWAARGDATERRLQILGNASLAATTLMLLATALANGSTVTMPFLLSAVPPTAAYVLGIRQAVVWALISFLAGTAVMVAGALGLVHPEFRQGPWEVALGHYLPMHLALVVLAIASRRATDAQLMKAQASQATVLAQSEELVVARDAALEGARAKSAFIANMSHELRTPLNAIIGLTSDLDGAPLSADERDRLSTIRASGETLLSLVSDLLDYATIEAGRIELDPRPFDLARCLGEAVAHLAPAAEAKGLALAWRPPEGLPGWVLGDRARLRQTLLQLLGNAVKFTEHGRVSLETEVRPAGDELELELELRVRDDGIGIPAAKRQALFQTFSQVDASTTRQFGGAGLGLAICAALVPLLGGRIWVESEPGRGSTFAFTVRLRRAEPPAVEGDGGAFPVARAPRTAPLEVLVAEDNVVNQKVERRLLEHLGHRVDVVADGHAALEAVARRAYDAVLLDVQMPGLDGLETARRIVASVPAGRRPRLVALTAHATPEDRAQCLAAGMDLHLTKPVRLVDLEQALGGIASRADAPAGPSAGDAPVDPAVLAGLYDLEAQGGGPLVGPLFEEFLADAPGRLDALDAALARGDARDAERQAHALKGSSGAVGVVLVNRLAATLEGAARDGRLEGLAEQAARLRAELARAAVAMRAIVRSRSGAPAGSPTAPPA